MKKKQLHCSRSLSSEYGSWKTFSEAEGKYFFGLYYNINYADSIYRPVLVTADISHIFGGSLYSPSALSCSVIYVFFYRHCMLITHVTDFCREPSVTVSNTENATTTVGITEEPVVDSTDTVPTEIQTATSDDCDPPPFDSAADNAEQIQQSDVQLQRDTTASCVEHSETSSTTAAGKH